LRADQDDVEGGSSPAPASSRPSPAGRRPTRRPGAVSDADEAVLQRRDAALGGIDEQLSRRLKRALQDEQNLVLDRLRTHRDRLTAAAVLGLPGERIAFYRETARPFLEEAARAGASSAPLGTVPIAVDDLATELAGELCTALAQRVERVLADPLDEAPVAPPGRSSGPGPLLAERIGSVYRDWKVHRAEAVAVHYLVAAFERGAYVARPEGAPLRWVNGDVEACPDCDDNTLAGPTPRGQPFPTGQAHPPAHPGCRCSLAPAAY
ncbi:MAG: hypothetical protein ACRD0F_02230, partial [Acidimicrobiales bacterium]